MSQEEVVRFNVDLNATLEVSRLEWEAYLGTNEDDEDDALWELGNTVDGAEFPIPDGRVWITSVDKITKMNG